MERFLKFFGIVIVSIISLFAVTGIVAAAAHIVYALIVAFGGNWVFLIDVVIWGVIGYVCYWFMKVGMRKIKDLWAYFKKPA